MKSDVIAPQQERSRQTLARLLAATIETLEQYGLAGTTIPRVALAAGVAPASVYRRFRDKDALVRAAFLAVLEQSAEANRTTFRTVLMKKRTLKGVAGEIIAAIIRQYRDHPGLLRALIRFVEIDDDRSFRKKALAYVAGNFRELGDVLLAFREHIAHPNPERAVLFGLLTAGTAIEERTLGQTSMWDELLPISDDEMQAELTRGLLAYLRSETR